LKKLWRLRAGFVSLRQGEDLYATMSRTAAGRYLIIYFVYKTTKEALIISAREMTRKEKRAYAKK
jgi:uncharacterized DUF497 family protein